MLHNLHCTLLELISSEIAYSHAGSVLLPAAFLATLTGAVGCACASVTAGAAGLEGGTIFEVEAIRVTGRGLTGTEKIEDKNRVEG
jgi:hypothetical protein